DIWAGDANDVRPGVLAAANLVDRRPRVRGRRVGHRLHGDRRVAADCHGADHDLPARPALDGAPGADCVHRKSAFAEGMDTVFTVPGARMRPVTAGPVAAS